MPGPRHLIRRRFFRAFTKPAPSDRPKPAELKGALWDIVIAGQMIYAAQDEAVHLACRRAVVLLGRERIQETVP